MKKTLFILIIAVSTSGAFAQTNKQEELVWHTDMLKAQEVSKTSGKPIFAFFTGSDWCGWCHKLQRDVLTKPAFIKWAQKNVVLVELDFPRRKQLTPELTRQNNELQQVFQVTGFPTIWMFFAVKDEATNRFNISALGSLGYPQGAETGKEEIKFLKDADDILLKNKPKTAP